MRAVVLLLVTGLSMFGQPRPLPRMSPVRPVESPAPEYSAEARASGVEGVASVYIEIGPDGAVKDAQLLQGLGLGLDPIAVETIRKWRFEPPTADGQPATRLTAIDLPFQLPGGVHWRVAHASYRANAADLEALRKARQAAAFSAPVLRNYVRPDDAACPAEGGTALVSFEVAADGSTGALQFLRGPELEDAVGRAIRAWRFEPARLNGIEVAASGEVLLKCAPATYPAASVYRVGGGVSAPKLVWKAEPMYSEEARLAKYQGTVLLYIEIDPDGFAENIRVDRPLGMGLDAKAIEAVRQWRFDPGSKGGVPVTVQATIEVNFRLL